MKFKTTVLAIIISMTTATFSPAISTFAAEQKSKEILSQDVPKNITEEDFQCIQLPEITDANYALAMEMAISDLEEKSFLTKEGYYINYYSSAEEAGVSQDTFDEFERQIQLANANIDAGNLKAGKNMMDVKYKFLSVNEYRNQKKQGDISVQFTTTNYLWGQRLSVSATEATKIQKVLAAGGGISTLASLFGVGLVWAAVFVFLYGIGEICNWNNKGYYLYHTWTNQMWCIAK